jgi:ATP-dependent RNA helicase RhlE
VYFVAKKNKPELLKHVIEHRGMTRTLVFVRTKHGADRLARHLSKAGIRAEVIHGNKTQNARQRALQNFKSNRPPVLVATDVAARGLDIDEVSHVVNYDLPNVPETYVHRIGRTGRAGASGVAVSFCDHDEREHLREIEKLLRKKTPVCEDHPRYPTVVAAKAAEKQPGKQSAKAARPPVPERKPHTAGPADGRQRSRRRKYGKASATATASAPSEPSRTGKRKAPAPRAANYTTMW